MTNVTVIIPTWNRADTIEKAIHSALAQTIPPLEVLVCDDGSTDNTRELVQAVNDPRVKWIQGARCGRPAIPRNRGIAESSGEWLAFLDSDDEWFSEKIERQLQLAGRLNCMAVCSNAGRFIPGKGGVGNVLLWRNGKIAFDDLLHQNLVICSSVLVHRSLFEIVDGFPESARLPVGEDYALWLRIATKTSFAFIDEPLLTYCDDPVTSIRSKGASALEQRICVFDDFKRWGKEHNISDDYLRKVRRQRVADLLNLPKATLINLLIRLKNSFAR